MTEKRYKLIESNPCEDPYDCRMYIGILEDDVKELYDYKSICDRLNELAEENEQLKKVIAENEKLIQSTYNELTKLRHIKKNLRRIKAQWNWIMEAIEYD